MIKIIDILTPGEEVLKGTFQGVIQIHKTLVSKRVWKKMEYRV
jgi:hypothetical protein